MVTLTRRANPSPLLPLLVTRPQMPLDMLQLASYWDGGRLAGVAVGSVVIQVGGLQIQGAVFDGTRFAEYAELSELTAVSEN